MLPDSNIQSDELSRCLFNESNDAYFVVAPNDLIVSDVNPTAQRITGLKRDQLIRRRIDELLFGENPGAIEELIESCRDTTFFHGHDGYRLQCSSGFKDVSVSLSRLHGESQVWSLIVLRDITRRKELERSLIMANLRYEQALTDLRTSRETITRQEQMRAVGHMASGVAHDLNNLLSPILNLSTVLLKDGTLDESTRRQLEIIALSARDAAESVRRLRRYRINETASPGPVSLPELIHEIPDMTRPRWETEQRIHGGPIEIDVSVEDGLPHVSGVELQLRQVLLNIVLNAIDAMPDGGRIDVHARAEGAGVSVEVRDSGTGMTADQLSRCLDTFFTTKPEGAGLGLSLSLGIVEDCGGRLAVDSDPGKGTTVRFWLPAAVDCPDAVNPSAPVASPAGLSILLIEDDDVVRESLVFLLETMRVMVTTAADGAAGVRFLKSQAFDAIITDMGMEPVNGWDVIRAARQAQPETRVCVLSGWSREKLNRQITEDATPDMILTKPVEAGLLRQFLIDAVAARIEVSN